MPLSLTDTKFLIFDLRFCWNTRDEHWYTKVYSYQRLNQSLFWLFMCFF